MLLAYQLDDLSVPLVVHRPQVGTAAQSPTPTLTQDLGQTKTQYPVGVDSGTPGPCKLLNCKNSKRVVLGFLRDRLKLSHNKK